MTCRQRTKPLDADFTFSRGWAKIAYFNTVQTKEIKYQTFLRPDDKPALFLNEKQMEPYREQLKKLYYQPDKYDTYLEQLGITYPTVRK